MKKQILLGVSALAFTAVSFAGGPGAKISKLILPPKAANYQTISSLNVTGSFTLELRKYLGKARYAITVNHAPRKSVHTRFDGHNLFISSNNKHADVIVYTRPLKEINTHMNVTVLGHQFNGKYPLNITATGNSSIALTGKFNVATIIQQSTRPISITWANSDTITVDGQGSGKINLAGVTQQLRAQMYNNSKLNAEYLRAETALISTNDNASAKVTATDNLRAFAHDNSNIYYYKQPTHITRESTGTANVLQMAWHQ